MKLYPEPTDLLSPYLIEKYDREADKFWELFYKRNGTNFFKDRHYLEREFPQLVEQQNCSVLEVGCGVGNAVYPLAEVNPSSTIYAVDFAPRAVELVKQHEQFDPSRIHAHVADITKDDLKTFVPPSSVDFCTMVFVLSAIDPNSMEKAISNIASVLKPGVGKVLFRDYAMGDLAEERLRKEGRRKKLGENFYVRGDGTRCYYFSEDFLQDLFKRAGFQCEDLVVHEREIENRGYRLSSAGLKSRYLAAWTGFTGRTGPDR
ncbi:hypothetical protein BSKO_01095 [Bryopsis sp. KO-2023]|nr:hypothetical protein BSKO_01095 [Bryopsis sp. KO-2023]